MSVIAVWGPPQSGKTTVTLDVAYAISKRGKSVCLVSTASYSELSALLHMKIPYDKSLSAAYEKMTELKSSVIEVDDLLYALAVPWDCDVYSEAVSSEQSKELLLQLENLFDYVVVDCESNSDDTLSAWAMNRAKKCLLLSGCHAKSVLWYHAYRRAVAVVKPKALFGVSELFGSFNYNSLCKALEMVAEFRLPYLPDAMEVQDEKKSLYQTVRSRKGAAYSKEIDSILNELEVTI